MTEQEHKEYEQRKKEKNELDKKVSIIVFSVVFVALIAGLTYVVMTHGN